MLNYSYNLLKFSYKSMFEIWKTNLFKTYFSSIFLILIFFQTLCITNYKLNGMHQCFIMKVKSVFNRFFHVDAINVTMITYMGFFWHTLLCFHPKCTMDFITLCWHDCFMSFLCTLNWPKCLLLVCKVWRKWIDSFPFLGPLLF